MKITNQNNQKIIIKTQNLNCIITFMINLIQKNSKQEISFYTNTKILILKNLIHI